MNHHLLKANDLKCNMISMWYIANKLYACVLYMLQSYFIVLWQEVIVNITTIINIEDIPL